MRALQGYIIRSTAAAFLGSLAAITAIVWMSQSLRDFDLITTKGQSFWTFLVITLLAVPSFAVIVAPIALFGAVLFVLNRMNTDSETAAINAAGVPPITMLRPFLILALMVSLVSGALSISAIPATLRLVREIVTEINTDIIVNVLREGEFTQLDRNITLHIRSREAGAALTGILIEDRRDPDQNLVYTAERGQIVKSEEGTYLLLEKGVLQRSSPGDPNVSIIVFDSYAFDLSALAERELKIGYRPRERYFSELWSSASGETGAALRTLRAELHERLVTPWYPVAFTLIGFAALSRPRTTRQNRMTGVVVAILLVIFIRGTGLALTNAVRSRDGAALALHLFLAGSCALALAYALGAHSWIARRFLTRRRLARTA